MPTLDFSAGDWRAVSRMRYDIEATRDLYAAARIGPKVLVNGACIEEGDGVAVTKESVLEFASARTYRARRC